MTRTPSQITNDLQLATEFIRWSRLVQSEHLSGGDLLPALRRAHGVGHEVDGWLWELAKCAAATPAIPPVGLADTLRELADELFTGRVTAGLHADDD